MNAKLLFYYRMFLSSLFDKSEGKQFPRFPLVKLGNIRKLIWLWVWHVPLCYKTSPALPWNMQNMHMHHWAHSRGNECATARCSSWACPPFNRRCTASVSPKETAKTPPEGFSPRFASINKAAKRCFLHLTSTSFFHGHAQLTAQNKHKNLMTNATSWSFNTLMK